VVLQGIDKKEISLPLAKLSVADQQYVRARLTPAPSGKNQQEAIAALEKLGAKTKKSDDGNVVSVSLALNGKLTDSDLTILKEITTLKELGLTYTKTTDQGLIHLKGLTNLEVLNLYGTKITDTGLGHLKALPNLEVLNLGGNRITDGCLVHLKGLTKLKKLNLVNTFPKSGMISDATIAELQKALPNCKIEH
jgi:hypothetical protein